MSSGIGVSVAGRFCAGAGGFFSGGFFFPIVVSYSKGEAVSMQKMGLWDM